MNKKNLLSLTILTLLIIIAGALAYYATTVSGKIKMTSKTFAFNVNKIIDGTESSFTSINLYDTAKIHKGVGEVIVPGDYGEFDLSLDSTGSGVDVEYTISLTSTNIPSNMKFYLDDKTNEIEINGLNLAGTLSTGNKKTHKIYWDWPFDSGKNNIHDIEYQGKNFTINVNITGKQVKPE